MSDLISRCELFNRLATIPASPEANELKAQIYAVIQSIEGATPRCEGCCRNYADGYVAEQTEPSGYKMKPVEQTEPQTEDKCKGCIYANGDSLMACVSCQGKVPYDGYEWDEPQTDCSWR